MCLDFDWEGDWGVMSAWYSVMCSVPCSGSGWEGEWVLGWGQLWVMCLGFDWEGDWALR